MTQIPVDYRNRPMKAKYLDEETPIMNRWSVFGTHPDGTVAVSDGTEDVLIYVPRHVANQIVEARNAFVDGKLQVLNLEHPESVFDVPHV